MEVFYTPPSRIEGQFARLGAEEARHIARVLRHKPGDHIRVIDGEGNEYRCVIARIGRSEVLAEILNQTRRAREAVTEVTLAPAVLKGTKMDSIVEMATELGVARISPVITARTVAALTPAKLVRFRHLTVSALKSSTRTMLPKLEPVVQLEDFLKASGRFDLKLVAYEGEQQVRLPEACAARATGQPGAPEKTTARPRRAALLVGPEGGFTAAEMALTKSFGYQAFTLGPRRLRAETACITALSLLLYELEEI